MRVTEIPTKKAKHVGKFGKLVLEDGTVFEGMGFGFSTTVYGEAVFNTGMSGYTEALTDPSYSGQILTLTYPLIGNYGVPDPSQVDTDGISKNFESDRIQARGLVVHDLSLSASHWNIAMTLDEWLYREKIPGISGVDTRALTTKLRTGGVMMAALVVSENEMDDQELKMKLAAVKKYNDEEFMDVVSVREPRIYGGEEDSIVVVDTGVKNAILRNVRKLGYKVIRVPWDYPMSKILSYNPKGVILSNGPGDPVNCG